MADSFLTASLLDLSTIDLPIKKNSITASMRANGVRVGNQKLDRVATSYTFKGLPAGVPLARLEIPAATVSTANPSSKFSSVRFNYWIYGVAEDLTSVEMISLEENQSGTLDPCAIDFTPAAGPSWSVEIQLWCNVFGGASVGTDDYIEITTSAITPTVSYIIFSL